jgi:hypothetical protein
LILINKSDNNAKEIDRKGITGSEVGMLPRYHKFFQLNDYLGNFKQSDISLQMCKEFYQKEIDIGVNINHSFFTTPIFTILCNSHELIEELESEKDVIPLSRLRKIYTET